MEIEFNNKMAPQEIVIEKPGTIANIRLIDENGEYIEAKEENGKVIIAKTNVKKNKSFFKSDRKKVKITEYNKSNPTQTNTRYLSDLEEIEKFLERANMEYRNINARIGK